MATVTPPAQALSGPQAEPFFIARVAALTGLDPKVVESWVKAEGAYAPNGTGGNNFLNIRESTSRSGVPLAGTTSNGFAQFHSAADAATETAHWINTMPNYLGIRQAAKLGPRSQLAAIAASPWDSGHYGGGKNLYAAYDSVNKGGGGIDWGGILGGIGKVGTDVANPIQGGIDIGSHIPGFNSIPGVKATETILSAPEKIASGVTTVAEDVAKVSLFVLNPSNWLRVGYILGGSVFVIGGLFILARSVGSSNAAQAVKDSAQTAAELTPVGREAAMTREYRIGQKQGARREGRNSIARQGPVNGPRRRRRPAKPRAGEPGSSQLGPGDSLPF